jgi:hypothetical protein
MITNLIFDGGLAPVIHDLLPAGVRAIGKIRRGCSIRIEGDRLPDAENVRMRVVLDLKGLKGNVPVRTVTFEPAAA